MRYPCHCWQPLQVGAIREVLAVLGWLTAIAQCTASQGSYQNKVSFTYISQFRGIARIKGMASLNVFTVNVAGKTPVKPSSP